MPPRRLGLTAAAAGVVAAGAAAAGYAAERHLARRAQLVPDPYADEPFGELHTPGRTVLADDGVELHVEVVGGDDAAVSIVFVHGFCLSMDCWHFQRRDLSDLGRLVFYDQRSHGWSGRSPRENSTIDQLGRDLHRVLTAVVPDGPVVLVGHSMGGMSILALADTHPELVGSRIRGVALIDTAAGAFAETVFGLPGLVGRAIRPFAPGVIRAAGRRAAVIEQGRRAGGDAIFVLARRLGFGPHAPASMVEFLEQMLARTPVEVMTEFFDTFLTHDKLDALAVLDGVPTIVMCGEADMVTPVKNSRAIAEALPSAELRELPGIGHMVMLEAAEQVNEAVRDLVAIAAASAEPRKLRRRAR